MKEQSFCDCLNYLTPARGGWSIVRTALLIPESHQLFVGAPACVRHIVLSSIELGLADRVSCLYLQETDVVMSYEELVYEGASQLLDGMAIRPKVLMLFMTCMDGLLGTDHRAFLEPLNAAYPETESIVCFMNPLRVDTLQPPGIMIQNVMYRLLKQGLTKTRSVNMIGNNVALEDGCELILHLKEHGLKVNHISDFKSFAEFQTMSCAQLNLVAAPTALQAAEEMKERLGIPWIDLKPSYGAGEILQAYQALCGRLELRAPDTAEIQREAEEAMQRSARAARGREIAIDYEATYRPFGMARLLLEHGYAVKRIYTDEVAPYEEEDAGWVCEHGAEMIQPNLYRKGGMYPAESRDTICIGFEAAYFEHSPYVVQLAADGGLWGFAGIKTLAEMIEAAALTAVDLKKVIDESVLIV